MLDLGHSCRTEQGRCLCCHRIAPEVQGRKLLCDDCRAERRQESYVRSDRNRTTRAARRKVAA